MKTTFDVNLGFFSAKWNKFKNFILRDKSNKKNFNIYDVFAPYSEASRQLELMREPINNFAKRNNVVIDVYENVEKESGEHILTTYVKRIDKAVELVRNIEADTTKLYPKESETIYIVNVKGEDTQIARKVKSSTYDNFSQNFFRNIEEMTKKILNPNE